MSVDTLLLTEPLYRYMRSISPPEPEPLRRARQDAEALGDNIRQIAPEQAQFLGLLVRLARVERVLEIGTFRGYSALAFALALPENGRVVTCDIDDIWSDFARRHWRDAGVAHKIEAHVQPALEWLDGLLESRREETFDLALVDADKHNHGRYYERALRLVRPGGLIVLDNVFWTGKVVDPAADDEDTRTVRALNEKVACDERVKMVVVPLGDGLTVALKL